MQRVVAVAVAVGDNHRTAVACRRVVVVDTWVAVAFHKPAAVDTVLVADTHRTVLGTAAVVDHRLY